MLGIRICHRGGTGTKKNTQPTAMFVKHKPHRNAAGDVRQGLRMCERVSGVMDRLYKSETGGQFILSSSPLTYNTFALSNPTYCEGKKITEHRNPDGTGFDYFHLIPACRI